MYTGSGDERKYRLQCIADGPKKRSRNEMRDWSETGRWRTWVGGMEEERVSSSYESQSRTAFQDRADCCGHRQPR